MKNAFHDSTGDYQEDAAVLENTSLPLYEQRHTLPQLPVPSIDETLEILLPSALPLARNAAESDAFVAACQKFPTEAAHLQKRLLARASSLPDSSWLQQWWNTRGYLQVLTPNVLHVSYFLRFDRPPTPATPIQRAAAVLYATQQYVSQLPWTDAGKLEHPTQRMCPTQFKYLFRSCRIPGAMGATDTYRVYPSGTVSKQSVSNHAVVAIRGLFFVVPLVKDGSKLSRSELEQRLEACSQTAKQKRQHSTTPALGWLTTQDRRLWGQQYNGRLKKLIATEDWMMLHSSVLLVAIEDDDEEDAMDYIMSDTQQAVQLWHGDGSPNRWHDKSLQIVVTKDGEIAGIIGEHSMADGMPALGYCQYLQQQTGTLETSAGNAAVSRIDFDPRPLFEETFLAMSSAEREEVESMVDEARAQFMSRTRDYDMRVITSDKLCKEVLKKAGLAPDAAVQMILQLASSRYFATRAVATYEAVQTRLFRHGRTETARSASTASAIFCEAVSWETLRAACDVHTSFTRRAVHGKGCDRHFLGLESLVQPGESRPQLLNDPVFQRSKMWLVSTSTVPTVAPGFGPPDGGFGIGYDIRRDHLVFTVSAKRSENSVTRYSRLLKEAIHDVESLLPAWNSTSRNSKL